MKSHKVKELMVPVTKYATVSDEATLYEAVKALEAAQKKFQKDRYRHRGVLIYDKNKKIIGKLGQLDILTALEPKYFEMQDREGMRNLGFSKQFMKSMLKNYRLLDGAMSNICKKAGETKVSAIVVMPTPGEFVDENDSINEAIHQLVLGHHQSLLVTNKKGDIVGILRMTDVFSAACQSMHECSID